MADTLQTLMFAPGRGPVVIHNGRFYISFGQCGFNSPANNRDGYATEGAARRAIARYAGKKLNAYGNPTYEDRVWGP